MSDDREAIETAWKIHGALMEWTGKVDSKASFALTLESAILAGVVALSGKGHELYRLHGALTLIFFWVGIGLLAAAGALAVAAVRPHTRRRKLAGEWQQNFIYFGHVKDWEPDELATALKNKDVLPVVSRQLVSMGSIAWTKHLFVQISMGLAVTGTVALAVAYFTR